MLLSFYLIFFCQFQPVVAYESAASKKNACIANFRQQSSGFLKFLCRNHLLKLRDKAETSLFIKANMYKEKNYLH